MPPSFDAFYTALYRDADVDPGRHAFLWQQRAAEELASDGWWSSLTAPTGAGKTTLAEAWLYALAKSGPEKLGRRLFWVVDRRAVVDQVHGHMHGLVTLLEKSDAPEVEWVRGRLGEIGGGLMPVASVWRGGLDEVTGAQMRADLDPAQVALISSTIDQVGSRLLFRGYGIGAGSRALHAGLVGIDSTIVLDEAHIAKPFENTLAWIADLQRNEGRTPRPAMRHVTVTATPKDKGGFDLNEKERGEGEMAKRLEARKWVELVSQPTAERIAGKARELAAVDDAAGPVIGIVLNTVRDARAAFEALAAAGVDSADRTLLIGPIRPLDRLGLIESIPGRKEREGRAEPFFVVATQTIEVGVDLDFDALVTASAPLPSLIQRVGRLDRRGERRESSVALFPPPRGGCPVYGEDAAEAWAWAKERIELEESLDLGPRSLTDLQARAPWPVPARDPGDASPRLLPLHVEALSRIDSRDSEVPDIDLFLHGLRDVGSDVNVIWRSDLTRSSEAPEVAESLSVRPPHSGEALSVSLAAVGRWLGGRGAGLVADVAVVNEVEKSQGEADPDLAAWLVRRKGFATFEAERVKDVKDLRPGDLVAAATECGGADAFGWAPGRRTPVESDLGSLHPTRPRVVLRATEDTGAARELLDGLLGGTLDGAEGFEAALGLAKARLPDRSRCSEQLRQVLDRVWERLWAGRMELLDEDRLLLIGGDPGRSRGRRSRTPIVTLYEHQEEVARRVASVGRAIRLDPAVQASLERAGAAHDEGKRDQRFQRWLSGGRPMREQLAKSTYAATQRRRTAFREAAGWPAGKRHEAISAQALLAVDPDDELAAWATIAHHGRIRPFPPPIDDPDGSALTVQVRVGETTMELPADSHPDIGWLLNTFSRLNRRFGYWGLAYLEAVLMTADRSASSEVENGG